jgi:hypothetical protein
MPRPWASGPGRGRPGAGGGAKAGVVQFADHLAVRRAALVRSTPIASVVVYAANSRETSHLLRAPACVVPWRTGNAPAGGFCSMPAANVLTMTNDCSLLGKPLRRVPVKGSCTTQLLPKSVVRKTFG